MAAQTSPQASRKWSRQTSRELLDFPTALTMKLKPGEGVTWLNDSWAGLTWTDTRPRWSGSSPGLHRLWVAAPLAASQTCKTRNASTLPKQNDLKSRSPNSSSHLILFIGTAAESAHSRLSELVSWEPSGSQTCDWGALFNLPTLTQSGLCWAASADTNTMTADNWT